MTTQAQEERVPELTLGWRLKMALGDMKRSDMADSLGVDPGTISRWCSDKGAKPKRVYLMQWALITGVSLDWLEGGQAGNSEPTPPGPGKRDNSALAALIAEKSGRGATDRYSDSEPDWGTAA